MVSDRWFAERQSAVPSKEPVCNLRQERLAQPRKQGFAVRWFCTLYITLYYKELNPPGALEGSHAENHLLTNNQILSLRGGGKVSLGQMFNYNTLKIATIAYHKCLSNAFKCNQEKYVYTWINKRKKVITFERTFLYGKWKWKRNFIFGQLVNRFSCTYYWMA